jgi:hypothetical protein
VTWESIVAGQRYRLPFAIFELIGAAKEDRRIPFGYSVDETAQLTFPIEHHHRLVMRPADGHERLFSSERFSGDRAAVHHEVKYIRKVEGAKRRTRPDFWWIGLNNGIAGGFREHLHVVIPR